MTTVLIILAVALMRGDGSAQLQAAVRDMRDQQGESGQQHEKDARVLLMNVKDALSSGNILFLKSHLAPKTYLNLFTGVNGYYSSEQAFLILESFFASYKPISFSFSSRNFSIRNPYGFGPYTYKRRGHQGSAEIFLSLAMVRNKWKFNQITIARR